MRPLKILKYLLLVCVVSLAVGCKLAVIVVEGGKVQSGASGTCQPAVPGVTGSVCIHQVVDTNYSETFEAVPDTGWAFVRWNSGGDFMCQDRIDPVCTISNAGTAGNASIEAVVASDYTFYIMPVFTEVTGTPITDSVIVDGKEWAQPKLFLGVSWNEINAQCPAGVCSIGSTLHGHDLTGWTWAGPAEVSALVNYYLSNAGVSGSDLLDPADLDDSYSEYSIGNTSWFTAFTDDFDIFLLHRDGSIYFRGFAAEFTGQRYLLVRQWDEFIPPYNYRFTASASSSLNTQPDHTNTETGAWFYRIP